MFGFITKQMPICLEYITNHAFMGNLSKIILYQIILFSHHNLIFFTYFLMKILILNLTLYTITSKALLKFNIFIYSL